MCSFQIQRASYIFYGNPQHVGKITFLKEHFNFICTLPFLIFLFLSFLFFPFSCLYIFWIAYSLYMFTRQYIGSGSYYIWMSCTRDCVGQPMGPTQGPPLKDGPGYGKIQMRTKPIMKFEISPIILIHWSVALKFISVKRHEASKHLELHNMHTSCP